MKSIICSFHPLLKWVVACYIYFMKLSKDVIQSVDSGVFEYIQKNIFTQYASVKDECHGLKHIYDVITRSFDLFWNLCLDMSPTVVFVVASYHDIGRIVDDETHEIESAKIFLADEFMKKQFDGETRKIIAQAIEDHRASLKGEPRNIYGKLVASADRNYEVSQPLVRTYQYRMYSDLESSLEDKMQDSYDHLQIKFGRDGYAEKVWFDDGVYEEYLRDLRALMENYDSFRAAWLSANGL